MEEARENLFMKATNRLLMAGLVVGATLVAVFQANAQYKPTGEDGITASPRVRKTLSERPSVSACGLACSERVNPANAGSDGIAASPKVREHLGELKRNAVAATASASGGVEATTRRGPNDGIVASPKLRELMREWPAQPQVEIAPIVPTK